MKAIITNCSLYSVWQIVILGYEEGYTIHRHSSKYCRLLWVQGHTVLLAAKFIHLVHIDMSILWHHHNEISFHLHQPITIPKYLVLEQASLQVRIISWYHFEDKKYLQRSQINWQLSKQTSVKYKNSTCSF